ncbi:sensor domain-containing diguanylate cyclase [Falsiroseomonas tokyonensis]|uniref:diguanylate cyclase n=1 Tax=Falsiroseomonas tokyonensis TaxID=430521 RepID=A0ABV7BYF4_9PROT|nr:diguanylate cyclase [Falsiroseomonas tokyonensis]MBU8539242.1 sensor domain-containing diguanylate cyclase [Falsiroseomonas tokyonensis]
MRHPSDYGLGRISAGRLVLGNLLVAGLYSGLGAAAGLYFARFGLFPSPIWLPAGVAAVACMLAGPRLVPGLFVGSFAVNYLLLDATLLTAGLISATNSLGPLAGAWLTRRLRPPSGLFTRLRGVFGFLAGSVVLHAAITSGGGTAALLLAGGLPMEAGFAVASQWLLSDAGGVFFLAPALMLWLGAERTPAAPGATAGTADALVLAATAGLTALVFALPPQLAAQVQPEAVFLLTIPVTWVTLRISLRAAYSLLTLISVVATIGTLAGLGPFQPEVVANPLRAVGMMIVLMATNALALMALLSERREAEALLAEGNARLTAEVAARTAELRQRAETDDLTGIGNRGHFLRRLDEAFAAARRQGSPLALVVLDLDHFRPLNDMRGHAAGDLVLQAVAQLCAVQLDGWNASFGRLGGEVFAALLPGSGAAECASLAEGMRAAVARHSFTFTDDAVPARLTASLGVTGLLPGDASAQDLLKRADAAVFLAKAKGRNRVEVRMVSEVPEEMRASNLSR